MSPEVAADAAEPLGVVTLAAVLSEAMALAAASPEVVAHAAEPPEAAGLMDLHASRLVRPVTDGLPFELYRTFWKYIIELIFTV